MRFGNSINGCDIAGGLVVPPTCIVRLCRKFGLMRRLLPWSAFSLC